MHIGLSTCYDIGRKRQLASITERKRVKANGVHHVVKGTNIAATVLALEPLSSTDSSVI